MKNTAYKLLLYLLRAFVYVKRAVFFCGRYLWRFFGRGYDLYSRTLGFRFYKLWFLVRRKLQKYKIPLDRRIVGLLARRGTLQVLLFACIILIIFPDSTLYSKEISNRIPGRQTLLYTLVGPGDQNFALDDIVIEEADFSGQKVIANQQIWKEGAVGIENPNTVGKEIAKVPQDLSSISAGGSALTKPTILPGTDLPEVDTTTGNLSDKRNKIIEYVVQPGDVIGAISQKYNVSLNTILWANDLTARSYIRPGDTLKIPPQSGVLHIVKRGETVSKIAATYDAEASGIVAFNKLQKDGADIVIGEELFIPDGEKPRPVYRAPVVSRPTVVRQVAAPPPSVQAPAGSGYIWPTSVRTITQYYGWRHTAVDIAGPAGSPLYAAKAGTVIKSQCGWNGGYGCYIILDHGGGVQTLYAHALQNGLYVSVGDRVSQGQTIAAMGSTGRSTGPHIHFEVRVNGRRANPLQYVR